jgi:hypothetical protein
LIRIEKKKIARRLINSENIRIITSGPAETMPAATPLRKRTAK